MREIENLQKLHEAQDRITSLVCRLAGLQGKCKAIIECGDPNHPLALYHPKEVELAKEMESELENILKPNQLKELLS
jgi:hypothetical protein